MPPTSAITTSAARTGSVTMFGGGGKAKPKKGKKAVKKAKPKAKSKSSGGPSDVGSLFVHSGDMLSK